MLDDMERADGTMQDVDKKVKELMKLGQVKKEDKPERPKSHRCRPARVAKAGKALGIEARDYPKL
jgi:hypothetical protein